METTDENKKKSTTMITQQISKADLTVISSLHRRRLGWSYLLDSTIADQAVGFPCEAEEFSIRRELKKVVQKISEWFTAMGQKNEWPSVAGWMWEIDFEASQAVPKKLSRYRDHTESSEDDGSACSLPVEGPIMTLGDMELDIIKRLLEEREALADSVRSSLRQFINKNFSVDKLNEMVAQLGEGETNVRNWFSEMAEKNKWPKSADDSFMYRVDIEDSQVYLLYRGNCSCSE